MDNARNYIVLKTAILGSPLDLCNGRSPQFYRRIDGHNQRFDGLMRRTMFAILFV